MKLKIHKHKSSIPVFATQKAGPIPTAYHPEGCYPYETGVETASQSEPHEFQMVTLENAYLSATICPDMGGRLVSLKRKHADGSTTESLFDPQCVRPVRILPRGEFIGGGIELSFPISHTPSLLEKVCYRCVESDRRVAVQFGERELRFGMQWLGEFSLGEHDEFLTQRALFHNPSQSPHPWMSWSNAGVPCAPDTEFHFPAGETLRHDSKLGNIDWKTQGPKTQADVTEMTGYFWRDPDVNAFGIYTPSLKSGLYHIADRQLMPGIKLWTDGVGRDEPWVNQYTLGEDQCLEIQAGPLADQSIKAELAPGQSHHQTEFWISTAEALDINQISLPQPDDLIPLTNDDLFGWARPETIDIFEQLITAHQSSAPHMTPEPPSLDSNLWAPSGMEGLDCALSWATENTEGEESARWLFQYGSWLAGTEQIDQALATLDQSSDPRAAALSAWLYYAVKKDSDRALESMARIKDDFWAFNPQIAVLHLEILEGMGKSTIESRERLLEDLTDVKTDSIVESRAALLLDSGQTQAAYDILTNHPFQLEHQHYRRTRLLKKAATSLGLPEDAVQPIMVGEDTLAEFGAYQEYTL